VVGGLSGEAYHYPTVPLKTGYPLLLRTLANLFVLIVHNGRQGSPEAYFFTLEQGFYAIPHTGDDRAFFDAVVDRLAPLATSQLIIENDFVPDLPEELWAGDDVTASITRAGRHLDELDLLPSPFPLEEYLTPEDFRHVRQLFQIGGLSYGNLSARKDATTFWMSASGVDKSRLEEIGRDILLVTDFLPERKAMRLSVPPDVQPRRVSVDAIEHWMIYREHPEVGAILHVHAWMEGITSTHINYPCGTYELAETVAELVRQAPDPGHAVIGLKNHGLTITGESLDEIFARIEGQILRQVPMS
jgi:ribulose-5-phosphate 4-epimerase/fuculose-1-phosphate aldolase